VIASWTTATVTRLSFEEIVKRGKRNGAECERRADHRQRKSPPTQSESSRKRLREPC